MKIESIFGLTALKKDKRTLSMVTKVDEAKMTNTLIEERLVLDHTLNGCMRYNPASRIKQCLWLQLPKACIVVMTTSMLLGWLMVISWY